MNIQPKPKLVAANWKMNGGRSSLLELDRIIAGAKVLAEAQVIICPPLTLLMPFADRAAGTPIAIGAQDCTLHEQFGAHTGEISTDMIKDAGAQAVILGHSERRRNGEASTLVFEKALYARRAALRAFICIGETGEEYQQGTTYRILTRQIAESIPEGADEANTVVVYEPIWAIGTGVVPSREQLRSVFAYLRSVLMARFENGADIPLLYGGSVNAANAAEILSVGYIDGLLIGNASLKADSFLKIASACKTGTC